MVAQSAPHNGWIKVYRRLLRPDHPLHPRARNEEACYMAAWIDLVAQAQWKSRGPLDRGQLEASERFLEDRWNWGRSRVRHFLEKLEAGGMIRRETDRGGRPSLITILNYDKYQSGAGAAPGAATGRPTGQGTSQRPPRRTDRSGPNGGPPGEGPSQAPSTPPTSATGGGTAPATEEEEGRTENEDEPAPEPPVGGSGAPTLSLEKTTGPHASPPDETSGRDQLESRVRRVEAHWLDWLSELEMEAEELRAFLGGDRRERARSKFRARIRDDGMTVDDLKQVTDFVMQEYWNDDDRLPWGGNLHPKSYLQNGSRAHQRLMKARSAGSGGTSSRSAGEDVDHDELRERRRKRLKETIRDARKTSGRN